MIFGSGPGWAGLVVGRRRGGKMGNEVSMPKILSTLTEESNSLPASLRTRPQSNSQKRSRAMSSGAVSAEAEGSNERSHD